MKTLLVCGGLLLLAAPSGAAQRASDSTQIFAVPAGTPPAPNLRVLLARGIDAFTRAVRPPVTAGAGAMVWVALAGAGFWILLRAGRQPAAGSVGREPLQC